MQISGQVALRYTSPQYKYQKFISVSENEACAITQSTIKELRDANLKQGAPHVLALVQDEKNGQHIYDGTALVQSLVGNKRWEWKSPSTNVKIKRIDFFVLTKLNEGYELIKKIKIDNQKNGQIYEDLFYCGNYAFATDLSHPNVTQSISAMIKHCQHTNDKKQESKWRHRLFQNIEVHYGRGIALLVVREIVDCGTVIFLDNFLFKGFNYSFFNELFIGSKLDEYVKINGESLFDEDDKESKLTQLQQLVKALFISKQQLPGTKFAEFLFKVICNGNIQTKELENFTNNENPHIAHLAQAFLCTLQKSFVGKFINNLLQIHPNWPLGKALAINHEINSLKGDPIFKKLDSLVDLSRNSRDVTLLQITAERFSQFEASSPILGTTDNVCMKILTKSRFDEVTTLLFANRFKNHDEFKNALLFHTGNHKFLKNYGTLLNLGDYERELGIKDKDKVLYENGIKKGMDVFINREKHNWISWMLGRDLIAEITPFVSSKEEEMKGVNLLKEEMKRAPDNTGVQLTLNEFLIRKGSTSEAKAAQISILNLKGKSNDPNITISLARAQLRFAEKTEDLFGFENIINELETQINAPSVFLLKALWQSHPLLRENQTEWYILAYHNLKKAFKNADDKNVKYLLENLYRYDKLNELQQCKCRTHIMRLLGLVR